MQKVEVTNNTTLKGGTNGTGFNHQMADSLIVRSGSVFDMSSPNMTTPLKVGGSVEVAGTLILSGTAPGDLEVGKDFVNNGTFNPQDRLITFKGDSNAVIYGSSAITFPYMTVSKNINRTIKANVPFTVGRVGGTTVRVSGGILDLNGQALTLLGGTNTLWIDSTFASGQTLRTGGSSIAGFNTYRRGKLSQRP